MAIAFDENTCFIATTISCEIMPALKGLNAIMAPFYGRVCPSAFMVIHDLLFPIAHGLQRASDCRMVDSVTLLAPTIKP